MLPYYHKVDWFDLGLFGLEIFFEWWYSVKVRYHLDMRLFFVGNILVKVICNWTNIWKLNIAHSFETLQEWSARSFNWSLILITLFLMLDFGSDYPSRVTDHCVYHNFQHVIYLYMRYVLLIKWSSL